MPVPPPFRLPVGGDLAEADARVLAREWRTLNVGPSVELDLADLELVDGPACAAMVDAVRAFVDRGVAVTLRAAPQALAHVLYRIGLHGRVALVDVRWEEPTVA